MIDSSEVQKFRTYWSSLVAVFHLKLSNFVIICGFFYAGSYIFSRITAPDYGWKTTANWMTAISMGVKMSLIKITLH